MGKAPGTRGVLEMFDQLVELAEAIGPPSSPNDQLNQG
jgi:hypothetical protein